MADKTVANLGNTIYDGASSLGEFTAKISMIIALVIGCVLIVSGIYFIMNDDSDKYITVRGVVIEPNCTKTSVTYDDRNRAINNFRCTMNVSYTIDGTEYSKIIFVDGQTLYIKNQPIDLMVNKNDHQDVQLVTTSSTTMGSISLLIALIMIAGAYLNYYMTHNYKLYAAAKGTGTVMDVLRR